MLAAKPIRRAFSGLMLGRASIFMIHRIAEEEGRELSVQSLRVILEEIRSRRLRVVSLESILERYLAGEPQLADSIAFTLDDGISQQMEITAPLLAQYDCAATVFLITGFIDTTVWPWDHRVDYVLNQTRLRELRHSIPGLDSPLRKEVKHFSRDAVLDHCKSLAASEVERIVNDLASAAEVDLPDSIPGGWEPLTWESARALERKGIRFAPHSVSHAILSKLASRDAEREIRESWRRVQEELAFPSPIFAWPTGRSQDFGEREIRYARAAGLIGAVTASCDYALLPQGRVTEDRLYRIGRFALPGNVLDFLQYATWIECAKQSVRRKQKSLSSRGYA